MFLLMCFFCFSGINNLKHVWQDVLSRLKADKILIIDDEASQIWRVNEDLVSTADGKPRLVDPSRGHWPKICNFHGEKAIRSTY